MDKNAHTRIKLYIIAVLILLVIVATRFIYNTRCFWFSDFIEFTPEVSQKINLENVGLVASFPMTHSHPGGYDFYLLLPKIPDEIISNYKLGSVEPMRMKLALEFYDESGKQVANVVSDRFYPWASRTESDSEQVVVTKGADLGGYRVPGALDVKKSYICNVVVIEPDDEINKYEPTFVLRKYTGK